MVAQGKIKEEKILQIGKTYDDYFITTTKFNYYIPKEVIQILYNMQEKNQGILYRNMNEENEKTVNIIKEKK